MSDLVFKLILQTLDRATAPVKALVATAVGGNAKVIASTAKATSAVQKFKVAETSATVTAKQLAMAAEGIKRGIQPTDALSRAIAVAKDVGGQLRLMLEDIGFNRAFDKQAHDADKLAAHAGHADRRLHQVLRTLVEMAELGPMGHLLAHLSPWIGVAAIGFAGVAAARGVYEMGSSTGERGADVGKRAQKVGLGDRVQDYQRLVYAANQFEVEQDALDTGLERFSKFAYSTQLSKKGGSAAKALKDIGINARDAHGKLRPILDVLPDVADRFSKMADGPHKTALALTLFSRSGANMIPMLNRGGAAIRAAMKDADDFGIVLGKDDVERSEAFVRAQKRAAGALMGLKLQLGTTLLGPLTRLTEGMTAYIKAHRPEIVKAFGNVVDSLAKRMPALLKAVSKVDWGQFALAIVKLAGALATVVGWGQKLGAALGSPVARWIAGIVAGVATIGVAILDLPIEAAVLVIVGAIGLVAAAFKYLPGVARDAARWVSDVWAGIPGFFSGLWNKVQGFFASAMTAIAGAVTSFTPAQIVQVWNGLPGFFSGLWARTKTAFLAGVASIWNDMPAWMRLLLNGAVIAAKIQLGIPVFTPGPAAPKPAALPKPPALPKAPAAAKPPALIKPPAAKAAAVARAAAAAAGPVAKAAAIARTANDNRRAAGPARALGPPRSLGPSGPPASIRRDQAAPASVTKTEFSGTLHIHITEDGKAEVRHVDSTEGFRIDVKRGQAA